MLEVRRPKCGSTDGMSDIGIGVGPAMNLKNRRLGSRSEILSVNRRFRRIQNRRRGTGSSVGLNSRSFEKKKKKVQRLSFADPESASGAAFWNTTQLRPCVRAGATLTEDAAGSPILGSDGPQGFEPSTRPPDLSPWRHEWVGVSREFDFEIKYAPGNISKFADALS